jgi:hypothetical protein
MVRAGETRLLPNAAAVYSRHLESNALRCAAGSKYISARKRHAMNKRVLASAGCLAGLAVLASAADSPAGVQMIQVYPRENKASLVNPGKGWIIYAAFAKASDAAWSKAAMGYARFMWRDVHLADNVFNWKPIDEMRDWCANRNKRFAFGIMPVCVNSVTNCRGMPDWVIAAGARFYIAEKTKDCKVPVWDDPVFLAKMGQLVAALQERYNGDPRIEFIDCRTFGNWGEWHLFGLGGEEPGDAVKQQFIDQWSGFDQTHIIVPVSGGTGLQSGGYGLYARNKYGFGAREDSSEHPPRWQTCLPFLDHGPAVAEWSFPYGKIKQGQSWTREQWKDEMLSGQILGSRYSYQPLGEWNGTDADDFLAEKGQLVDEWQNRMGYWFKMTAASYPVDLANGTTGAISFKMRNDGVAPLYLKGRRGVVKAALLDDAGKVLVVRTLAGVNPGDWKPAATVSNTAEMAFPRQVQATRLALGVFSRESLENPDIKLGIEQGTPLNWYVLSDMPGKPE